MNLYYSHIVVTNRIDGALNTFFCLITGYKSEEYWIQSIVRMNKFL